MRLLFDMDGPLVHSGQVVDDHTTAFLAHAATHHDLFIVTGSPPEKVRRQLKPALKHFKKVWCNNGNGNTAKPAEMPEIMGRAEELLSEHGFVDPIGEYFEPRPGGLNLSPVGQDADQHTRELFAEEARYTAIREIIAATLEDFDPRVRCTLEGAVSIDVSWRGHGKEQVYPRVKPDVFFCDSLGPWGGATLLADWVARDSGQVVYCPHPLVWWSYTRHVTPMAVYKH